MEWQPIETAPLNTRVLIDCEEGVVTARKTAFGEEFIWELDPLGGYSADNEVFEASAWTPLPAPPQEKESE